MSSPVPLPPPEQMIFITEQYEKTLTKRSIYKHWSMRVLGGGEN